MFFITSETQGIYRNHETILNFGDWIPWERFFLIIPYSSKCNLLRFGVLGMLLGSKYLLTRCFGSLRLNHALFFLHVFQGNVVFIKLLSQFLVQKKHMTHQPGKCFKMIRQRSSFQCVSRLGFDQQMNPWNLIWTPQNQWYLFTLTCALTSLPPLFTRWWFQVISDAFGKLIISYQSKLKFSLAFWLTVKLSKASAMPICWTSSCTKSCARAATKCRPSGVGRETSQRNPSWFTSFTKGCHVLPGSGWNVAPRMRGNAVLWSSAKFAILSI